MRSARSGVALAMALPLLVAAWGCDSEVPPVDTTTAEATVSGTVTVRGKPMAGGEITFDPSNIQRKDEKPRKAAIGPDGTYTVTTLQGRNSARISGPMLKQRAATGLRHPHHRCQTGRKQVRYRAPAEVIAS